MPTRKWLGIVIKYWTVDTFQCHIQMALKVIPAVRLLPPSGFHASIITERTCVTRVLVWLMWCVQLGGRKGGTFHTIFVGLKSLNSMSNYEPLEIILFKTVLIFLRAGLLAVIRKNINLSEFLSKLGRFVGATFDLRLRNIDQDRL